MIAIIDYGVGNLFSLKCSFESIGADICVTSDPKVISKADRIILPGVGAFEDAARKLRESGLDEVIKEVKMVVEGVYSAKAALKLAKKYDVEMPIIEQVNAILFDGKAPADAVSDLMLRDKRNENADQPWE